MLGGRNNQNQRGRATEVYSRTTHHLRRCNLRFNFGHSDTLAGKLNASVVGRSARLLVATGEPGRATWPIQNDSLTWMPAGEMSVKLRRRCVERTAISSAIQPSKGFPTI